MNFSQNQQFQIPSQPPPLSVSQSLNFAPNSLASSLISSAPDEILTLKKSLRQKEAEFMKEKALLLQQVELLRMQLRESEEKEANLKKMNENIMSALQNTQEVKSLEIEINEDHPKVAEILRYKKQEYLQANLQEKERHRESEYALEKENQTLNFKVLDLSKQLEIMCKEMDLHKQEYQNLLKKYQEEVIGCQDKVKNEYESTVKRLQNDLEIINADIERQVILRLNEKYSSDQCFNETIIKYQKEQQIFLDEQKEFRKKIDYLELQTTQLTDKLRKTEDESGAIKYKMKQQEKKHKEEMELIRKQKDEQTKRIEQLEGLKKTQAKKGYIPNDKSSSTTVGGVKSRNQQVLNKENIMHNKSTPLNAINEEDEEKNKLRRQISLLRCQLKKLEIDLKDLKMQKDKEIAQLKDKLNVERKKRMNLYEEKIDKNNQLLQDLLEKDQTIFGLQRQITKLQEKLSLFGCSGNHNRSQTPNHMLGMSLQESMINQGFTSSLVDLNPVHFNQQTSSKRLISPLRSLDLSIMNNPNSVSFSLLPLSKDKRATHRQSSLKKDSQQHSPKQIRKRNRIHSVQISNSAQAAILMGSINGKRFRQRSRDGSIQEVNEDLYKDSVESCMGDDVEALEPLERKNIMLQFGNASKVQNYYSIKQKTQDDELRDALQMPEDQQLNKNEIYFDSLENQSQQSSTDNDEVTKLYKQFEAKASQQTQDSQPTQPALSHKSLSTQDYPPPKKHSDLPKAKNHSSVNLKQRQKLEEEEDCLVNILESGADTSSQIEMIQPTITGMRQMQISTENLMRDSQATMDSFRNAQPKKTGVITKAKLHQNANIPKPQLPNQKAAAQKMQKMKEIHSGRQHFDSRKNSIGKPSAHGGDGCEKPHLMKSPSSPNILCQGHNSDSSHKNKGIGMLRLDSCPSPLDEDETIVQLGSGEKLRIKEMSIQNFDQYQNQFKEQRNKFNASILPPSAKNIDPNAPKMSSFGFRTRTNSLINSCCSEISFKMKFIRDMPLQPNQISGMGSLMINHHQQQDTSDSSQPSMMNQIKQGQKKHSRMPSMNLNHGNKSMGSPQNALNSLMRNGSYKMHK